MHASSRLSTILFASALTALALALSPFVASLHAAPPTRDELVGSTWELVSCMYGDATEWQNATNSERKLKLITDTHFIWLSYSLESGEVQGSGGGTWTIDGANYTETVQFGDDDVLHLRNEKHKFTFDLKGDRLEQTGALASGFKIAEVWQRVR
jgi:hypothetical protein